MYLLQRWVAVQTCPTTSNKRGRLLEVVFWRFTKDLNSMHSSYQLQGVTKRQRLMRITSTVWGNILLDRINRLEGSTASDTAVSGACGFPFDLFFGQRCFSEDTPSTNFTKQVRDWVFAESSANITILLFIPTTSSLHCS